MVYHQPVVKLDRDQIQSIVEPHWRRLYNFVFRLTLDRDRAERYLRDIFAAATSQLSKAQILQQASTAMVAQANTVPQNILTLLQKLP